MTTEPENEIAVTLSGREWHYLLEVAELGIESLESMGCERSAGRRSEILEGVEDQVGEPSGLHGLVSVMEEDCGLEKSWWVEETGRSVSRLQD